MKYNMMLGQQLFTNFLVGMFLDIWAWPTGPNPKAKMGWAWRRVLFGQTFCVFVPDILKSTKMRGTQGSFPCADNYSSQHTESVECKKTEWEREPKAKAEYIGYMSKERSCKYLLKTKRYMLNCKLGFACIVRIFLSLKYHHPLTIFMNPSANLLLA